MDSKQYVKQADAARAKAAQFNETPRERALRSLEDGADAAVKVGRWVRGLAADEAKDEGALGAALEMKPEAAQWGSLGREVFGSLYGLGTEPVEDTEAPVGADWIREVLSQAESLPEWKALQERARSDAWASGLATAQAMETLAPTITPPEEDAQDLSEQAELLSQLMQERGQTSPKHLRKLAEIKRRMKNAQAQDASAVQQVRDGAAHMRSNLRRAAAAAGEQLDEMQDAMDGMGCGRGAGPKSRVNAPRGEVMAALRDNDKLRRIARLAGRLRAQAIAKQNTKAKHGVEELCDVMLGSDIGRLLPSETVFLADPDLEVLLYRKLVENAALQYELRGREQRVEGPIVLVVDESGSMSGAPDEWAKAVALALMEVAARQNRAFAYVHFDTKVSRVDFSENPKNLDLSELLAMVTHFTGGGTSIAAGLGEARRIISQAQEARAFKRADVVLISDGVDGDSARQLEQLRLLKNDGAALFTIGIGCEMPDWLVEKASASTVVYPGDMEGASGKLDAVFSV